MTVQHLVAQVAVRERSEHGEGPLWDPRSRELLWVDQYLGLVRTARPAGDRAVMTAGRTFQVGGAIGAVVPHQDEGWVAAAAPGFLRLHDDGRVEEIAEVLPPDGPAMRMNDGKVDPLGRFWAGSLAFDKTEGAGVLYVLEQGAVRAVRQGLTISNGLAWTPDGRTLYFIDTPTGLLQRFAVASDASLREDGVVARAPEEGGAFDGMCIDAEGCLWVALWGAGAVHRYAPTGELLARVAVDAPQVSSCAFGGDDLGTLFITTSQEGYHAAKSARHPHAGCVFSVQPGVDGVPAEAYRG